MEILMVGDLNSAMQSYQWNIVTIPNIAFGLINGALNTLPLGSQLFYCGQYVAQTRNQTIRMSNSYYNQSIIDAVGYATNVLYFSNNTMYNCYFGAKSIIQTNYFYTLVTTQEFINVILFNVGYMWIDIIMILVATP